ncbi:DUF397 domain-containing protein [Streptomyces sp. NPDC059740]
MEVARDIPDTACVRDSKAPEGPFLTFPAGGFTAFLAAVTTDALSA